MTHYWRVRARLPERFGQHCRIIAVCRMNNILVEFEDGYRAVTCRYYVRKLKKKSQLISLALDNSPGQVFSIFREAATAADISHVYL